MLETPAQFEASRLRRDAGAPAAREDLSRYRYHTGATPRPLARDEPCPVLFRDLGTAATARFLRGGLPRLAGPHTPLLYLRTAAFREPYDDHEQIGRLVILRPLALWPWHSGVPGVFVARATNSAAHAAVGYVPGSRGREELAEVAREAATMRTADELREALGGRAYDEACEAALARVERLEREVAETDAVAAPLRAALCAGTPSLRARARRLMEPLGLSVEDVCAAWHHIARPRRAEVRAALARIAPGEVRALREALR